LSGNDEKINIFCNCYDDAYWIMHFLYDDECYLMWIAAPKNVKLWNEGSHAFHTSELHLPNSDTPNIASECIFDNVVDIKCSHCGREAFENEMPSIKMYVKRYWNKRLIGIDNER
jgi:hypothetical protein